MAYNKTFEFTAAVRGFHYYKTYWKPEENQSLDCFHENNNVFDRFAIKVCEFGNDKPVGHLPKEISRVTKFLLDRGASMKSTLTSVHYRRSPLVQGGLEIPCKITVTLPGTVNNLLVLARYQQLVEALYTEPKEELILGSFLHIAVILDVVVPTEERPKRKKNTAKSQSKETKKQKDIRNFFGNTSAAPAPKRQKVNNKPKKSSPSSSKDLEIINID
ncbi:uncharacterized protein LOC130657458 [Hydractinia symbiolongicarpus]|uniref:uncharacterized protein LOC130612677 n=1 Tax=Hydractinia symbiolongicarpus TaxID=13093 RepID=UPI00254E1067|nr:uncharacterized protein LOC130612677 [Hydractinia symbiolongicarpus]XP_057298550.1 uncharacterized protein LOC130629391 [Hydractinia symbiolongicarpus]XP_057298836.1 uncharacterized protein LOC130629596 [Hydractinia symbiolongicarpus]XP_057299675.1 uncharacterized protein LOC130630265 [Hydractinia symbiolongicarpus]XP_057299964.1 uncharacterized protein LOC130630468 [Hydractinia symbiolongicarpus]XP_057299995.1 uncharacterized protein LOC130630493 [Hydractinia symbiolongicarpus]XP_05730297